MRLLRLTLAAAVLAPMVGCKWIDDIRAGNGNRPVGPVRKATPEELVGYLNTQAGRLQTLTYTDVRLTARSGLMPLPALRGNLAASQPRSFRMSVLGGFAGGKVDLGSNPDQFWVYVDAPTQQPVFVFASHTDFETGRARLPGNVPFEPDWVMQALGMTTFRADAQYTVNIDEKERTYTLGWPATTPAGVAIRKEVVFNAYNAESGRPQVRRHVIRDAKNKVICSAEVKAARAIEVGLPDPQTRVTPLVHYPTHVVLRWEEQRFEMDLELNGAQVNQQLSDEQARRLFTRPNIGGREPINLAEARFDVK